MSHNLATKAIGRACIERPPKRNRRRTWERYVSEVGGGSLVYQLTIEASGVRYKYCVAFSFGRICDKRLRLPRRFIADGVRRARAILKRTALTHKPLSDDTLVVVSIYGRLDTLEMTWVRARDRYVRSFGIDAIQDCRKALESGGRWTGYTDTVRWVAVTLASAHATQP